MHRRRGPLSERQDDGAAVDSLVWEYHNSSDPSSTSRPRVVERSPTSGNPPVVVHPDLGPALARDLKEVLLTPHEDPGAQPLMRTLEIDRCVEGDDSAYDSVRDMRRRIEQGGEPSP